jgi:hypothetical protein
MVSETAAFSDYERLEIPDTNSVKLDSMKGAFVLCFKYQRLSP